MLTNMQTRSHNWRNTFTSVIQFIHRNLRSFANPIKELRHYFSLLMLTSSFAMMSFFTITGVSIWRPSHNFEDLGGVYRTRL